MRKFDVNLELPLWQLTAGQLLDLIASGMQAQAADNADTDDKIDTSERYVYGIAGIAKLLGCSNTMVHKHRKDGWIEPAIRQRGRKIICDAALIIELFNEHKKYTKTA
jgi:hypothetical protein